jgi:hypothetical protein
VPAAEATLPTPNARRYVTQLGKHATAMACGRGHQMRRHDGNPLAGGEVALHVEQSADRTTLTFDPWGVCTVHAELDRIALRIDAADEQNLRRIQQIITRDIERFGHREHLSVAWRNLDPPADPATAPPSLRTSHTRPARRALAGTGLLAVVVLIGVHLGLGSAAAAWLGWTAVGGLSLAVLALVGVHVAVPVAAIRLRRHRFRRGDNP